MLSLYRDLGVEPERVHEVQEMETALGLMAAGVGLCLVTAGAHRLRPEEVVYRPIKEPQATSPIIMSTRLHEQNADLNLICHLIDDIYRELGLPVRMEVSRGVS